MFKETPPEDRASKQVIEVVSNLSCGAFLLVSYILRRWILYPALMGPFGPQEKSLEDLCLRNFFDFVSLVEVVALLHKLDEAGWDDLPLVVAASVSFLVRAGAVVAVDVTKGYNNKI